MTVNETDSSATSAVIKVTIMGKEATKEYTYASTTAGNINYLTGISSTSIVPYTSLELTLTFD